jgi:hypothetical protein
MGRERYLLALRFGLSTIFFLGSVAAGFSARAQAPVMLDFDSSEPAATLLDSGGAPLDPQRQTLIVLVGDSQYTLSMPLWVTTFGERWGVVGDVRVDAYRLGSLGLLVLLVAGSFAVTIRRRLRTLR